MRVGILGGTFDPPHVGHCDLARIVLESELVDEVWFVPCLRHAFGKQPVSFEHRIEMIRLLIAGESKMSVSDMEKRIRVPGRTLDLVRAFKKHYPKNVFHLVAGSDIFHERHKWHRFDEIVREAPPIYVERRGVEPISEPTLKAPPEVSSTNLRNELSEDQLLEDLIPKQVAGYIKANKLYGVGA